jgi:hypothetical protein
MSFFGPPPTVLQRLERGLAKRKSIEDKFQLDLFNRINEILSALQQCPAAVAALPSDIADQLSITKPELDEFIRKLENPDNMGRDAIEDIVDPLYKIGRDGDNTLRRTEPGVLPGAARVLPRSIRNPPRGITGSPGSVASGPEAPGSYRPPSLFPSWFSRSAKPPVTDVSGTPRPAGREPYASALESSNKSVNEYRGQPPTASRYSGDLYDMEGGSRRKTRRARKYRNRT